MADERTRYSDAELEEFKQLILKKLENARADYELLRATITHTADNDTEDTSPTFKVLEEGAATLSKEESGRLAAHQMKFIRNLEMALVRIENKTYGICKTTGKLIPQERLYPVVLMMCTVGAYATLNGRMFDVWCLLLFGIVGLLIKKFHFPVSCFLIGFILGGDLEDYFIQVLTAYNGSLTGLFVRPMSWVIWALIILSVVYAVLDNRKAKRQEKELSGKQ